MIALGKIITKLTVLRDSDCRGIDTQLFTKGVETLDKALSSFTSEVQDMPINKAAERYGVTTEGLKQRVLKHGLDLPVAVDEPSLKVYPRKTIEALDSLYPHN